MPPTPKPAPATPVYVLQMQAAVLVSRLYDDDDYRLADDLDGHDPGIPQACDPNDPATPGLCGVNPYELREWSAQADRAIERRHFVAAELTRQRDHAKAESARFRERAARLDFEIERVKAPAVALMLAKRALGEVDKDGRVKVKTPCVSAWLIESESVDGPEDVAAWPVEFRRIKIEADRAGAKDAIIAYRALVASGVDLTDLELPEEQIDIEAAALALGEAGVTLRPNVAIGWRS